MADIDDFAILLLEEAKRFLEKAKAAGDDQARTANLHASLLLGFSGLEAHVNAVAEEFSNLTDLSVHEMAVLLEKDVRLENGDFVLGAFRMFRLEDRILFLCKRFSGRHLDKSAQFWHVLKTAQEQRNGLTHPKAAHILTTDDVGKALQAIIDTIDALYRAIYKSSFPYASLSLDSKLNF